MVRLGGDRVGSDIVTGVKVSGTGLAVRGQRLRATVSGSRQAHSVGGSSALSACTSVANTGGGGFGSDKAYQAGAFGCSRKAQQDKTPALNNQYASKGAH